ncbi:hypothetical protein DMNBHIDG_01693 [Candidatus Methanoperedenaceae archaeon GB37]|nr:hypothetical protein DMNBHIDG_01693 [Candidatus Methanoperedenaceae archaeon GB37]
MSLSLDKLIEKIKNHPHYSEIGMIACHLGLVRGTSRNGQPVKKLSVQVNHEKLKEIITNVKEMPGIVETVVETKQGVFTVGETIMAIAVAGDIREHVVSCSRKNGESYKNQSYN